VEQGKSNSLESAIKSLNAQLTSAKGIQDSYVQWTVFLKSFTDTVPTGITLTNLQVNAATQSFRIAGTAKDRATLLEWQETLKTFKYFTKIVSPISNLAQKDQVTFEITGQLTPSIYE
jgi:Tfp pilus assembly protein PilN